MGKAECTCPWTGCRASELSARVKLFMDSLLALRATLAPIVDADTQLALTRMLAVAQLKFGWVEDLPFFLWQGQFAAERTHFFGQV